MALQLSPCVIHHSCRHKLLFDKHTNNWPTGCCLNVVQYLEQIEGTAATTAATTAVAAALAIALTAALAIALTIHC